MRYALLLTMALFAATVQADTTTIYGGDVAGNISQGHVNLSGSASLVKQSGAGDPTTFTLTATARYFVVDRWALGGSWAIESETGSEAYSAIGPSVAFYWWASGNLASHLGVDARFGLTDNAYPTILQGTLALDVFLLPSVALSPALFYTKYSGGLPEISRYGLSVTLGIYL